MGLCTNISQIPGLLPYSRPVSQSTFQVSNDVTGIIGTFISIASRKGPFLKECNAGGYTSGMVASGNITTLILFFNLSAATLNARNDDILLSRLTVISIVLKKKLRM